MLEISILKARQAVSSLRLTDASPLCSSYTVTLINIFISGLGLLQLFIHLALESNVPPLQSWQTNSNLMKFMSVIFALINRMFLVIISGVIYLNIVLF